MTSLVIRYNVYIFKDPKNFMNVDNCIIVQLQTKDQLMMDNTGIKGRRAVVPFIINITMEINFSSKVYSKNLLKVGSLYKGSVVYSLILDYQFCACVMRTSGVPQLQVIRMERLYGYK